MSIFSRSSTKSASSSVISSSKGKEAPPPTSKIFTTPPEGIQPRKKWEYNDDQLNKISQLREYTSTLILPESHPYHPWEARFLADPGCHPRYMRAAKWKLQDAKHRIKGTIEWRREFKPELISPDEVSVEAETGKIILSGFDEDARPVLYLRPGRENTETSPRQIKHLIYHLERAIDLMPPGQEQVAIIVDYKSATSQSNPSISTGRKVLSILQNHYVERLGRGLVVNMSWWISAFFSGISPFLDPITRDKIRFNPKLEELVPLEQLDYEFGGQYHLEFDHAVYWRTLTEFCHLAGDGTRVNDKGEKWYPPLGNGIKAAVEGLVPRKGSVSTGDVVKADSPDAQPSPVPYNGVSGHGDTTKGEQPTAAELIAAETRKDRADTDAKNEGALVNGTQGLNLNGADAAPVPAVDTKPGEPVGDLVFDHPPTTPEIQDALKATA